MKNYADEIIEFKKAVRPFLFVSTDSIYAGLTRVYDHPRNLITCRVQFISSEYAQLACETWKDRVFFVTLLDLWTQDYLLYVVEGNLAGEHGVTTEYNRAFLEWLAEKGYS